MAKKKSAAAKPTPGFVSQADAAAMLGLSDSYTYRMVREADAWGRLGKTGRLVDLRRLHESMVRRAVEKATAKMGGDPDMVGSDSPALERFRTAKAKLAELELADRTARLVDREALRDVFARSFGVMRRGAEQMKRQYGRDAHALWEDTLTEAARLITEAVNG